MTQLTVNRRCCIEQVLVRPREVQRAEPMPETFGSGAKNRMMTSGASSETAQRVAVMCVEACSAPPIH